MRVIMVIRLGQNEVDGSIVGSFSSDYEYEYDYEISYCMATPSGTRRDKLVATACLTTRFSSKLVLKWTATTSLSRQYEMA